MMVIETIAGGLGGLNAAIGMVKGLNTEITEAKVAEAKIEIIGLLINAQHGLLDAQQTLLEDTDTIRALEAEIVKLKDWSAEAERYEPADAGAGVVAYRAKGGEERTQRGYWLCPQCFADRQKSFLIPEKIDAPYRPERLRCNRCGWTAYISGKAPADARGRR